MNLSTENIKFRGKRIDNGQWVFGSLVHVTGRINHGCCYITEEVTSLEFDTDSNVIDIGGFYEVDPKTVGRFTGFCDRNGEDVYEEDIVTEGVFTYVVVFYRGSWCARLDFDSVSYHFLTPVAKSRKRIGNVHDNTELLWGKEQINEAR